MEELGDVEASTNAPESTNETTGSQQQQQQENERRTSPQQPLRNTTTRSSSSLQEQRHVLGAVSNLCSATLGAGILGLPYAFSQAGLVWSSLLLVGSAVATYWSLQVLSEACHQLQHYNTYEGLTQQLLGGSGRRLTEVCMLVFCGGCAVAYIVAVGDILEPLLGVARHDSSHTVMTTRSLAMMFVWAGAMLPLSLLKTMEHLQKASFVGILAIGILVLSAVAHLWLLGDAMTLSEEPIGKERSLQTMDTTAIVSNSNSFFLWPAHGMTSVLQACPILLFAFSCQVNVCAIYQEYPDKPHFRKVLYLSVLVCATLYAMISTVTLMDVVRRNHANHTAPMAVIIPPNVLQLYCPQGLWQICFYSMAVAVVVAFPLNVFPARVTLEGLLLKYSDDGSSDAVSRRIANDTLQQALLEDIQQPQEDSMETTSTNGDNGHEEDPLSFSPTADSHQMRHVCLTVAIAGGALALALVVPNISVVFGLLGGSTSSILGFVLPGWLGVKMQQRHVWKAWILLIGGIVVAVVTTGVTVYATIVPSSSSVVYPNPCLDAGGMRSS